MLNQTRESTNSELCGWSTGKHFLFHLGDPENQVRMRSLVRSSARLLSSGDWPGHWRTPFFALRNSRVDFAVCFGLSICSVKRCLISFAAFSWIWAASMVLYTLVHPAIFVSSLYRQTQFTGFCWQPGLCHNIAFSVFHRCCGKLWIISLLILTEVNLCFICEDFFCHICSWSVTMLCPLLLCFFMCVWALQSFSIRWCFWPLQVTVLSRFLSKSNLALLFLV